MSEAVRVQGIKREANQSAYKGPGPRLESWVQGHAVHTHEGL